MSAHLREAWRKITAAQNVTFQFGGDALGSGEYAGWAAAIVDGVYAGAAGKTALPAWRQFSSSPFWKEHDAVIVTMPRGRGRYFEVYTYGEQITNADTLAEAKQAIEEVYGPLSWKRITMDSVEVIHYYFGPTTEFTSPTTIYVVDSLPKLGTRHE